MDEQRAGKHPPTLLEALFDIIDTVARRVVDFMPLGRGIRKVFSSTPEGLIGWDHVRDIAVATLELQRDKPGAISTHMVDQYQNMLAAAKQQVAAYTGLAAEGLPETVSVFGQPEWIDANIISFRFLFDPISEKYVEAIEEMESPQGLASHRVAHTILTIQLGIIMGYLSRNVLGQYDLSLPEPDKGGRLYVVETNVGRVESQMGLDPREFRQWITLHEVTHSFEFHCNGWLRGYLASSMQEYLRAIDWRGLSRPDFFRGLRSQQVGRDDALRAGWLISIISTPEQREILGRLQAIMCVLEGYSNHVMDGVGKQLLSTYETMKERFDRRRQMKSGAERLFQRMIGLELKLQQYKLGQSFVEEVVDAEGMAFLNRVWESAELMPDIDEIRRPADWVDRVKEGGPRT